jgi:hypothetical protein
VVQGGPETGDNVASDETHGNGQISNLEMHDVLSSFKIILERKRIGIALQEVCDLGIQSAKVMLRPTHLQAGIEIAGHFV